MLLHTKGTTNSPKVPPELTPLVLAEGNGLPKTGEYLVLDKLRRGGGLLVRYHRQHTELRKGIYG